jgi:NarL family two-component system response regulator YdfI
MQEWMRRKYYGETLFSQIKHPAREKEVLTYLIHAERNVEIAFRLGITERTQKAHFASIYNKFGMDSRTEAISVAMQRGLLDLKSDARKRRSSIACGIEVPGF